MSKSYEEDYHCRGTNTAQCVSKAQSSFFYVYDQNSSLTSESLLGDNPLKFFVDERANLLAHFSWQMLQ